MTYSEWIYEQYIIWRGSTRRSVSDFAAHIGVSHQVLSSWMKAGGSLPGPQNIAKLVAKFGPEVYDVLGIPRPAAGSGVSIALLGRVIAGKPIPIPPSDLSRYDPDSTIQIALQWLPDKIDLSQVYALEVEGDSMIDLGINDRTIIVMLKTNTAEPGDIVAVCIGDEDSATLKRFFPANGNGKVRLQPANGKMKPILVKPDKVHIVGKLVLSIRRW